MISQEGNLLLESSENQGHELHILVTVPVGSDLTIVPLPLGS